ncbi:ABC transporter substrate-binding protein [Nesterenkonia populi]
MNTTSAPHRAQKAAVQTALLTPAAGQALRRTVAGAVSVASLALLAACGSGDSAAGGEASGADEGCDELTDVAVQFGWHPNVENMATIVAEQNGYFEDECLSVEILPGGPEVTADAQIVSGNADMGILSSEALANAVINEAPLVGIGMTYQNSPSVIVSLVEAGIEEPSDLEGLTFGVSQLDMRVYEPFFASVGVDWDAIDRVDIGADPAALVSGEVDAMSAVSANQPVVLRNQGHDVDEISLADYDYNRWSGGLVVREDSLEDPERRETIMGMARAVERGLETAVEDPQAAGEIVFEAYASDLGLEEETQLEGAEAWASLTTAEERDGGLLLIDEDGVQSQQDFFDNTDVNVDASAIFDLEASQEAFGD